jgi:transcriptional regulator with XRE-family HTH domain
MVLDSIPSREGYFMTLAQRVRDQRYAKGWGPDELASRASISRTALYQIESGKTEQPRAATIRRIAQALDIPTESLLGPHLGIVSGAWAEGATSTSPRSSDSVFATRFRIEETPGSVRNDLDRKFHELLASPLGEGVARIVEESYRILPRQLTDSRW